VSRKKNAAKEKVTVVQIFLKVPEPGDNKEVISV
jgi:hypothetical protein